MKHYSLALADSHNRGKAGHHLQFGSREPPGRAYFLERSIFLGYHSFGCCLVADCQAVALLLLGSFLVDTPEEGIQLGCISMNLPCPAMPHRHRAMPHRHPWAPLRPGPSLRRVGDPRDPAGPSLVVQRFSLFPFPLGPDAISRYTPLPKHNPRLCSRLKGNGVAHSPHEAWGGVQQPVC